tara:strand:+ start:246570 stop:247094 length:525 start_codon:yes stop_codon:yes gene_type:complete
MNIKHTFAAVALLIAGTSSTAMAQTTASQKFTVTVPSAIAIIAPANVSIIHDESENDQPFQAQQWVVKGNSLAGVAASFSTNQAFTHTTDPTSKRNAQLGVAINSSVGAAAWTVTQPTDTTDYANNDGVATVAISSNGFGRANVDITVAFITDGFGSFASGEYDTTVTGTVTAN